MSPTRTFFRPFTLALALLATPPAAAAPTAAAPATPAPATAAPAAAAPAAAAPTAPLTQADLDALLAYIKTGWQTLTRGNDDLLAAAKDDKHPRVDGKWPVYVADTESVVAVRQAVEAQLPAEERAHVRIVPLHQRQAGEHGILYLPNPYVVPGGRFNEMYAWDSYFIVLGLLRDGEVTLAKGMVDNALYEIVHYGTFLNANRSYYLTRSQPPNLTSMVLAVYEKTQDDAWLRAAIPLLDRYYAYWTNGVHQTKTGLSRYYDRGQGPAPEVVYGEVDAHGQGAYARIRAYFRGHTVTDYNVARFYDRRGDKLTPAFYLGDRSMRESGFDPSRRFGAFNADVTSYNPVCLNTLLYVMEGHMAALYAAIGDHQQQDAYIRRGQARAEQMAKLLWDEAAGQYFDYNYVTKKRRNYPFATTFYPLWAGLATPHQAARVAAQLSRFIGPGGLRTSLQPSGNQWDAPYGWAPLQLLAVGGLRRYGYHAEADRLSIAFLRSVLRSFVAKGAVFEKYDVDDVAGAESAGGLKYGYTSNEVGFGWTNAVFLELYAQLPAHLRGEVLRPLGS